MKRWQQKPAESDFFFHWNFFRLRRKVCKYILLFVLVVVVFWFWWWFSGCGCCCCCCGGGGVFFQVASSRFWYIHGHDQTPVCSCCLAKTETRKKWQSITRWRFLTCLLVTRKWWQKWSIFPKMFEGMWLCLKIRARKKQNVVSYQTRPFQLFLLGLILTQTPLS